MMSRSPRRSDPNARPQVQSPAARSALLPGGLALALGLAVLACVNLFPLWAVQHLAPFAHVGANTGLCLALGGAGLLAARHGRGARYLPAIAGLTTLLVAAATLLQPLHGWYADSVAWQHLVNATELPAQPGLWPGMLRRSAALAFVLAGLALLLPPRLQGRRRELVHALGLAVVALALPSVFSNMLGNMLFDDPARLLLPVPAALGLAALGLGLAEGGLGIPGDRADLRIFATSLALFSLISLTACLVGIGIVGRYAMHNFEDAWRASSRSNAELLRVALARAAAAGADLAGLPGLDAAPAAGAQALQRELERAARIAHLGAGDMLAVLGPDGRPLARAGSAAFPGRGALALALPLALTPRLYWNAGWRLLTEAPLGSGARVAVDLALTDFNDRDARTGRSGRTRICGAHGAARLCIGPGSQPAPALAPMFDGAGGRAAAGPDGERVIAAHTLVAGTGLTLVQTVEREWFYGPLRRQLWGALCGMALLVLAGALVLYRRTRPLVLGLVRARARLGAILENVPAGVFSIGPDGTIRLANRGAGAMFGYAEDELAGMDLEQLVPGAAALLLAGAGPHRLAGVRRDGAALALEVVASQALPGAGSARIAIVQDVGERVRMEQALRQREASLAHAQQLAHIGSWERDLAGGACYWSDETFRIFGLEPGGAAPDNDSVARLVHPEDRAFLLRSEREAVAGGRGFEVKFRVLLRDGTIKVLDSRAVVEFDGAGRALRFRGTIQDITAQAWADAQLRKREEEYRALVENSPDVVSRFDRELRCVYVNPAIGAAPGLAGAIAYGRVLDGAAPGCAPWVQALTQTLWSGATGSFEVSVDDGAGRRHYQVQVVPEFREGGRVATVLATARDISAIRNGEAVLRESEQRLAGIAANTPGAVFQWMLADDGQRGFTYVSEGVARLFGETPGAVLAVPGLLARHFEQDAGASFEASLARSAATLETFDWEGRVRGGAGATTWINCRATPRRKEGATIWEGVMLDISASKRNEQELSESRQLLRALSAHSEQVREEERKKIAREVHDELGQALTALRMDVALLRRHGGPHSPALLARIQAIKEAVDRTIGTVRNVTSALRPAALDLGLTAALEWQLDEFARRSGIGCLLHAGETEVVLDDGAATALFRIVQESLTNVVKHAAATAVEVTLAAGADAVRLEVCDNGRGFAAAAPPRPGRFGLVGMRERVLMLGGSMEIRSGENGGGTCILVRLPPTTQPGASAPHDDE